MMFRAYLDTIEDKTGRTARHIVKLAKNNGFDDPAVKASVILGWLVMIQRRCGSTVGPPTQTTSRSTVKGRVHP
jgi:hypothetical protein